MKAYPLLKQMVLAGVDAGYEVYFPHDPLPVPLMRVLGKRSVPEGVVVLYGGSVAYVLRHAGLTDDSKALSALDRAVYQRGKGKE